MVNCLRPLTTHWVPILSRLNFEYHFYITISLIHPTLFRQHRSLPPYVPHCILHFSLSQHLQPFRALMVQMSETLPSESFLRAGAVLMYPCFLAYHTGPGVQKAFNKYWMMEVSPWLGITYFQTEESVLIKILTVFTVISLQMGRNLAGSCGPWSFG